MSSFNKITPSAAALGAGTAFHIIEMDSELQTDLYKLQQTTSQVEANASKGLGTAIEQVADKDADALEEAAIGSIVQGGVQGAGEFGAWGIEICRNNTTTLQDLNKESDNIKTVSKAAEEADAKVSEGRSTVGIGQSAEELTAAEARLQQIKAGLRKEDLKEGDADVMSVIRGTKPKDFEKFQKTIRSEQRSVDNQISDYKQTTTKWADRFRSFSQAGAGVGSGICSLGQASAKRDSAALQNFQQQANFVYDAEKRAFDSNTRAIDGQESSKQAAIQTLLQGLADSNRV